MRKTVATILFLLFAFVTVANAAPAAMPVSAGEFERLAVELAPKVNLFRDVWEQVPEAQFFGGTSRDYLYWLKGRLILSANEGRLGAEITKLRAMKTIDVREFILFESDVDVASDRSVGVDGTRYGIKKIDHISAKRFDPATPEGKSEIDQGFVPVEKIRLGKTGFVAPGAFGDGLKEIYEGRPTVHFATKKQFESTHYAQQGLNHPVLLALRYLRLLGINYFQSRGSGFPDRETLLGEIDPASGKKVRAVIAHAITSGELKEYLENEKFKTWLNGTIQKAFRSYTNPTAAKMLYESFGADRLPLVYTGIEPINQYLFKKLRDERAIAANWKKFGAEPRAVLENFKKTFPDGRLYHGTRSEVAFRSILFQGILPSDGGAAGAGLYGVAASNAQYAANWAKDERLVVMLDLDPKTRIVDIRAGAGLALYEAWTKSVSRQSNTVSDAATFAEAFGFDLVAYPYETHAFVLTNADVIRSVQGWKRKLMKLDELRDYVESRVLTPQELIDFAIDNSLAEDEMKVLFELESSKRALAEWAKYDGKDIFEKREFALLRAQPAFYMIPMIREAIVSSVSKLGTEELKNPPDWLLNLTKFSNRDVMRTLHPLYFEGMETALAAFDDKTLETKLVESFRSKNGLAFTTYSLELERRAGILKPYEAQTRFIMATNKSDRSEFDEALLKPNGYSFLKDGPFLSSETAMAVMRLDPTHEAQVWATRATLFETDSKKLAARLSEIAARPDGLEILLHVDGKLRHEHQWTAWSPVDTALSKALAAGQLIPITKASNVRWTISTFGSWFERAMQTRPAEFAPRTLLRLAKFAALDHTKDGTWEGASKIFLGILKSARLANDEIGREVAEAILLNRGSHDWWKFSSGPDRDVLRAGPAEAFRKNGWESDPLGEFYASQARALFITPESLAQNKAKFLAQRSDQKPTQKPTQIRGRAARSCPALFR